MKSIVTLMAVISSPFSLFAFTESYGLKSDICYRNEIAVVCDQQYRTTVSKMNLDWVVKSSPLQGFLRIEATHIVPSKYVDELVPVGFHANFGIVETNKSVYVYNETAWVNTEAHATSGFCKIQIQFQRLKSELIVRFVGIREEACKKGAIPEILREMTFQRD